MNLSFSLFQDSDAELVNRARAGDRDSFGQLVSRHQGAVCGVAYAVCGDFAASEDLAQEAFVSAWLQLGDLEQASRFRAWVCGISRLLSLSYVRRRTRRMDRPPVETEGLLAHAVVATAPDPADMAVSEEEKALLWRSLDRLPERYREPLVLFYREQQSVAAVAEALELTEEAVKQRLSRGRVLLREELAGTLEKVLFRTRPGAGFAAAVLAALPPAAALAGALGAAGTAKAATATGSGIGLGGGGGPSAAIGPVLPFASLFGGLVGAVGVYVAFRYWRLARFSPGFRGCCLRLMAAHLAGFVFLVGSLVFVLKVGDSLPGGPALWHSGWFIFGLVSVYLIGLGLVTWLGVRKLRALMAGTSDAMRPPEGFGPVRWETRGRFLGLPWISFAVGTHPDDGGRRRGARAWLAVGDLAFGGLLAVGGVAVAPISIGGVSVGLFSLGGFAVGGLALGGVGLGGLALAGIALGGMLAVGGLAFSGGASVGAVAVAGRLAIGPLASAPLTGGDAWLAAQQDMLCSVTLNLLPYSGLLSVVSVPFLVWALLRLRKVGVPAKN